jgi:hypothetical protein
LEPVELLYPVPCSLFAIGRDRVLAIGQNGRVQEVEALAAAVLERCHGSKTLQDHLSSVVSLGWPGNAEAVKGALDALVADGLLRRLRRPATVPRQDGDRSVATVAFVTADRPALLARGLRSAIGHAHRFGRRPALLVVDGSQTRATETRAAVTSVGATVDYLGAGGDPVLRDALAARGIPADVIVSVSSPGSIGSNRNIALLRTAGEPLVMIDDDVLCEPWAEPDGGDGVVIGGHVDLRAWRFYATRADAVAAATGVDLDILAAHGTMLGRSLEDLGPAAAQPHTWSRACGHLLSAVDAGRPPVVRLTVAGLAGDSARYCPGRLLFQSGPLRDQLWKDPGTLATALGSREVHHIARSTTIVHEPMCASYCMGIDNTRLVPPFLTVGRGEDTVFAAWLAMADPDAVFAHLPVGVVHDSPRDSAYGPDCMPSATETRLAEFLLTVTTAFSRTVAHPDTDVRLMRLGQHLVDLGSLPIGEFAAMVTRAHVQLRAGHLASFETAWRTARDRPPHVRAAVDAYERALRASRITPDFFVPVECRGAGSIEDAWARTRARVVGVGRLLLWWPEVWAAAAELRLLHSGSNH